MSWQKLWSRYIVITCTLMLCLGSSLYAQAVFESNTANGDWDDASSWTLISGTDANGVPDSNDDVTILSGDRIDVEPAGTVSVDDLTIVGRLNYSANNRTLAVGGNLVMSGASSVTGNNDTRELTVAGTFTVSSGATATINGQTITISGATTLNGSLSISNNRGVKTFANLTVAASGTWNNTTSESFTFAGNLENNGSWTGCSGNACLYSFTNSSGTISGSEVITFADVSVGAAASISSTADIIITDDLSVVGSLQNNADFTVNDISTVDGTLTNNAQIIMRDDLIGTGTFTNGTNASLEMNGNSPISISNIDFSANPNTLTITGASSVNLPNGTYHDLEVNKTGTARVQIDGNVTINNDVTITSGELRLLSGTSNIGSININGGEFAPNGIAVIVNVSNDLMMSSGAYDHNDGDVNITGDLVVTGGTMTMNQGAATSTINVDDFSITAGTVTLSEGELNVNNASGGLTVNSGSLTLGGTTLVVTNDYDLNGGTNDFNSGSFSASSLDIASSQALTVANLTFSVSGDTDINGSITFDNNGGTKTLSNINVNSGGSWINTTNADFTISGNITSNGSSWAGCGSATGCDYTLTSGSGIISGSTDIDFSDLIITGSYTNQTTVLVTDRFTGSGSFTNANSSSLSLEGSVTNVSNFTASADANTVTYARAGDQTLMATVDGYFNLVINTIAAGNDVSMASAETIINQLTMTTGDIILGTQNLVMDAGATISGGNTDSYIRINSSGVLRQNYTAAVANLSLPIGDDNDYSPITAFTINSGTFGSGAYVEFDITDGLPSERDLSNTGAGGDDDGVTAVAFISRFWELTGNNISDVNFDATYQYVDADVTGDEASMIGTLYRTPPGESFEDWAVIGAVNAGTNTVSISGGDAFGILYAMDNTLNRLPIVLLSFEAKSTESTVELVWVTASEESNDFYTIERSVDGQNFHTVLTVDGAGDSEDLLTYRAVDGAPLTGRSFYRLKQTDFNGQFEYSEIRSVLFDRVVVGAPMDAYPNPVRRGSTLSIDLQQGQLDGDDFEVVLLDLSGNTVWSNHQHISNGSIRQLVIPTNIRQGIYIFWVTYNGKHLRKRLVIQ